MNNPEGGTPSTDPGGQKPQQDSSGRQNSVSDQWNTLLKDERVQQARQVSKQYLSYFLSALAHPYSTMKSVGPVQTLNGLITMALMAILSPLYFFAWFIKSDISPAFGPGFLKPLLLTVIGIAVALGLTYAVLKIEKVSFDPKLLLARFGVLIVPAVAVLAVAILFLICSLFTFSTYLLALSFLFIFIAMNSVLFQYPLNALNGKIDTLYLIAIANAATAFVFYKLIVSVIAGAIGSLFSSFPFGY